VRSSAVERAYLFFIGNLALNLKWKKNKPEIGSGLFFISG